MAIRYKAFWRDIPLGVIGFDIFDDYMTSPPDHPRYGKLFMEWSLWYFRSHLRRSSRIKFPWDRFSGRSDMGIFRWI